MSIRDEDVETEIRTRLRLRDRAGIGMLAERVSAGEWAAIVMRLDPAEILLLVRWLPERLLPGLMASLDPQDAAAILLRISRPEAADLLEAMAPDDATDVIVALPAADAEQILFQMEAEEADAIRDLLAFAPDSAGGIMTPAFVAVSPDLRADQAIAALHRVAEEAETVAYVYVIDEEERLLGVLSLHRLVLTRPDTPVRELLVSDPIRVRADADQETAARQLTDHNLLALPVVDDEDHLLGIITQDDIADVIEAEATEDIERLGGSQPLEMPYRRAGIGLLVRRRVIWLLLLFVAEAYTGTVLRHFETEITQVVALSFFIPLLIGTGGNIGSQVTTTLVRAMAVGEVRLRDIRWVLMKEAGVGLVLGAIMAVVAFGRSQLLNVGLDVGLVIAITIAAICVWSATVAAVLPLLLGKLRIDPAIVSAPLITTLVDGTGLVIYFTIAKYMLGL
jgi:magnesium transporter